MGKVATPGDVVGLVGPLGIGKTTFVQGVAVGLGVPRTSYVNSPTFPLIQEYRGGRLVLFHADLYRIHSMDDLESTGFRDILSGGGLVVIEWLDQLAHAAPPDTLTVTIEPMPKQSHGHGTGTARRIRVKATGQRSKELARRWRKQQQPS